jgi:dephospho-CoA kinase
LTQQKRIIGLAGGIGSGKSEVARILSSLGAGVIDSDRLSAVVLQQPDVISAVRSWWGEEVVGSDGMIDRGRLASIAFSNEADRRRLEQLQHPRIAAMRETLIRQYQADPAIRAIVLDSPLLFEAGLAERCDCVIFVEAAEEARLQRVKRTRQWNAEELRRRENSQMPLDTKREKSDYIVENNTSLDALREQVERIISSVLT